MTARMILPRRRLIGPNPTEASEPLPVWRGTEISNPFPSSEESANFHSLEPEALTDPARQALRSTRLVDLFIALCTASDECNPEPPRDITNVKRDHRDLGLADLILAGIKRAGASFTLRALS